MLRVQLSFQHFMEVKALYIRVWSPYDLTLLGLWITLKINGHLRTLFLFL